LYNLLHFPRSVSVFVRKMIGRAVSARPEGRRKLAHKRGRRAMPAALEVADTLLPLAPWRRSSGAETELS
jgi:hypothetical protein